MSEHTFMQSGTFLVGCNYWASHAGMMMWRDWQPETVAEDLKQLSSEGLQILRVFPLWPDFQPLRQIYGGCGNKQELHINEKRIRKYPLDSSGVSEEALDKFSFLADEAQKNGLQLIVGLITGWMSGRLFVPPAFEGLNVLTDPLALKWQSKFVKTFVHRFKKHSAISAWDLGNECNVMGRIENSAQAWVWTEIIAGSIRQEDSDRPIVSGMHSLSATGNGNWRISDQGELTDILTTHPYPIFTPYCNQDPINEIRNGFHATAECRLYSDLSGRPCFAEEMGTLGPMVAGENIAAEYTRSALFSLWAHDCRAMLWWCAFDQMHLDFDPYDQIDCERELGLIGKNRRVKPVLKEIASFRKEIESLPFTQLPLCKREAVCLITEGQDAWGAAYSCYILAKQAGFDITFQHIDEDLLDAPLYILPSINGMKNLDNRTRNSLLEKVEGGASLYVSFGDAFFEPFKTFFGLDIKIREKGMDCDIHFHGVPGKPVLKGKNTFRLKTSVQEATILAKEENGNVAFSCNKIGDGKIYYLSFPLEQMLSETPGVFHSEKTKEYFRIYQEIGKEILSRRVMRLSHPFLSATEHPLDDGQMVAVVINHSSKPVSQTIELTPGWKVAEILIGNNNEYSCFNANDGKVILLKQE